MKFWKFILLVFCFAFSMIHGYAISTQIPHTQTSQETTYTTYLLKKHKLFIASTLDGILFAGIQGKDSQNCWLDGGIPLKNGSLKCGIYSFEVHNGQLEEKYQFITQTNFTLNTQEIVYEYPNQENSRISVLFQCSADGKIQKLLELMYQKKFSCKNWKRLFYQEAKTSMQEYIKNNNIQNKDIEEFLKYSLLENNIVDTLVYFDDDILVFERSNYLYTGGPHGMPTKRGVILSKNEGLVDLDKNIDFNNPALKTLLWKKYQAYLKKLPKDTPPPTEAYINFEDFKVSDAVLLDYEGIIFLYQPYEIMPYSYGIIRLKIPFMELKQFEDFQISIFRHLLTN